MEKIKLHDLATIMHSILDVANETYPELITCVLGKISNDQMLEDHIKYWKNENRPVLLDSDDNATHRRYITTIKQQYEKFAFTTPGKNKDERQIPNVDFLTIFSCDPPPPKIDHGQDKKYQFLFLVGKPHPYRLDLLTALLRKKLLDDILISFRNSAKVYQHLFPRPLILPEQYEWPDINKLGGYDCAAVIDSKLDQAHMKHFGRVHPLLYRDTAISIVSEGSVNVGTVESGTNLVTEKTWIPLVAEHLIVFQASPGHRQFLEELGFETKFKMIPDYNEFDHEMIADICLDLNDQHSGSLYDKTRMQRQHNRGLALDGQRWKSYHLHQLKNFNWDRL